MEGHNGNKTNNQTMNFSLFKLALISNFFGKSIAAFYKAYVYNCNPKNYLKVGRSVMLAHPLFVQPTQIELGSFTRLQQNVRTIISPRQKVVIKKFTAIGAEVTIIPGNHTPTVSLPQYLSYVGINDINNTLTIEEDVWVGANSTLLYKANIGRGAVIAANSVVTKKIPPYAVVSGIPAKIIATRFSLEQIKEHERCLYAPEERLGEKELEELFANEYVNLKSIGTSSIRESYKQLLKEEKEKLGMLDYKVVVKKI